MTQLGTALIPLLLLSCASSVELSSAPKLTGSTDPSVVGQINEQVAQIAVHGDRLYWLGSRPDPRGVNGDTVALRSCLKAACASSLISYATERVVPSLDFEVQGDQVYWFQQETTAAGAAPSGWSLLSCPVSGCGLAAPRRVASGVPLFYQMNTAFAQGTAYLKSQEGVFSIALADTDGSPQLLQPDSSVGLLFTAEGDYLYELASDDTLKVAKSNLQRVRRDGSDAPEILVSGLKIPLPDGPFANRRLAVDSSAVYWIQGTLYGSIARCNVAGCDGQPELFLEPVASATLLQLDGDKLYWQHYDTAQGYVISSCSLRSCSPTTVATGVQASNALAIDDQYLYTATADQVLAPEARPDDPWARIRRFPK